MDSDNTEEEKKCPAYGKNIITPPEKGGPGYIPPAIIAEESFWLDEEADLDSKWPGRIYKNKSLVDKYWT